MISNTASIPRLRKSQFLEVEKYKSQQIISRFSRLERHSLVLLSHVEYSLTLTDKNSATEIFRNFYSPSLNHNKLAYILAIAKFK